MRTKLACIALAALVSTSAQAAGPDELCARLRTFEIAQLPRGERRWVEFHWGYNQGPTAAFSWACIRSKDQLAKTTCEWFINHTDQELSMLLPQRVMACHGYRFPRFAFYDWKRIKGTIVLRGASDRRVLMDLNYGDLPNPEQAMRVSVEGSNGRYEPEELPSIRPMSVSGKAVSR